VEFGCKLPLQGGLRALGQSKGVEGGCIPWQKAWQAFMRRQHPFISLTGFALTALFLVGLGVSIWLNGGQAFSPGNVSAVSIGDVNLGGFTSHADFENQCNRCHAPLQTTQDVLCLNCHVSIRDQIASGVGYHGQIDSVEQCAGCHSEHQGREFSPALAALKYFDHEQVSFSLSKHPVDYAGTPMKCASCHLAEGRYSDATVKQCDACHASQAADFMSKHVQDYGPNCTECHDGQDRMPDFDHTTTAFPLTGKHITVTCDGCHAGKGVQQQAKGWVASFQGLSSDCEACHAEPAAHAGVFDSRCINCHTTNGWLPARWQGTAFEHDTNTSFSLVHHHNGYDGQPLTCTSCHTSQLTRQDPQAVDPQVCTSCHSTGDEKRAEFMRLHIDRYGEVCLDCHDGVDRMANFDHSQVFPLDGVHGEIECTSCHVDRVYHGTPRDCVQCHAEPAIHAGVFGVNCQDCHMTQAWAPARLQVHDFPLDHGKEGEVACTTCHVNTYTSYTCYGCHEHQPGPIQEKHIEENVALEDLPDCASCHPDGE
jgi:hypothetical protein